MGKKFEYEITPIGMSNNAWIWFTLYRQNINLNTQYQLVAVYCLLIGFEMLLKSYLIFLNKDYCQHRNLKKLGHNFATIYEALIKEKNAKYLPQIKEVLNKYELLTTNIDTLRYPKKGDAFLLHSDYYKIPNDVEIIFDTISSEINREIMDSFYK